MQTKDQDSKDRMDIDSAQYTLELSTELKGELLVYGYIRKRMHFLIPDDVIQLCLSFYLELAEMLSWDPKSVSKEKDWISLTDSNRCATKKHVSGNFHILPLMDAVTDGIHCWRIQMKNPNSEWFIWGIANKDTSGSYANESDAVYGISHDAYWPRSHTHHTDRTPLSIFLQTESEIDIHLNLKTKTMKLCVIGSEGEVVLSHLPNSNWVPYCNFGHSAYDTQIRIAKIPEDWYSKNTYDIFKEYSVFE